MPADNEVFFETTWNYRHQWPYYLVVVLLGGADLFLGTMLILALPSLKFDLEHLGGLAFMSLWILGTGTIVVLLLRRMIFWPTTRVQIDTAGITVDRKLLPWEEIDDFRGVAGGWGGSKIMLRYHLRTRWPLALDRHLPVLITVEEYETLFARLDEFLDESFPHVSTD